MRLLLTGSTGFVGRNFLLDALQRKEYETIHLPVRDVAKFKKQTAQEGVSLERLRPFESSCQQWRLGEAADCEHVVHSAGVIFARTQAEYQDTNVEGTVRLFRELRAPKRVVVLSSLAAAGPSAPGVPRREDQIEAPVTWYGSSKLEMERRLAREFPNVPYVCLRPPMIFGPRDQATLPLFKMVRKPIHFKAGFRTKQYSVLSVEDLASAIRAALEAPAERLKGRVYFVAHSKVITDRDILSLAAQVCDRPSRVLPVPQFAMKLASRMIDSIPTWRATIPSLSVDRAKEIWPDLWVASADSFQKDSGWTAQQDFPESMRRTHAWYRESGQL